MTTKKQQAGKTKKVREFNEDDVKVLRNLEAVRAKPTMYIGPMDDYGIFTVIREPADNVTDEYEAGRCKNLIIKLLADGFIEVHDDGQGLPVGIHKEEKLPTIEVLVSILHAGGKLKAGDAYKNSKGTHGVGVKATNATGEEFRPVTFRDKAWHTMLYKKGVKKEELRTIKASEAEKLVSALHFKKGTIIRFKPDYALFDKGAKVEVDMILEWAEMAAYMSAGITIQVMDLRGKKEKIEEFCFENGLMDWLDGVIETQKLGVLSDKAIEIHTDEVDLVMQFTDADGNLLHGYCNGLYQSEGGNHFNTTLSLLFQTLKPYMIDKQVGLITREDIGEGLLGIVHFKADSPRFGSQTKNKLTDPRFEEFCKEPVEQAFATFWSKNKGLAKEVLKRAQDLRGAKQAFAVSKAAMRELKTRAGNMSRMPGKLAMVKCDADKRELFLVEGDSAGGTAKSARMTTPMRYQETLPLKGKCANAFKTKLDRLMVSEEVLNILTAIGFNPESADPLASLRVGRILMLSDPDPDGKHINSLILALLAEVLPGVFARGMVFAVGSPKYYLSAGGVTYTAKTLPEMQAKLPKGVNIERASYLKGWGEIQAAAMRDIAFNPETRELIQIKPPSKKEMEEFRRLMGEDRDYTRQMLGIEG